MIRTSSICFVIVLLTAACKKNAECSGTVFSKNHAPVPNATILVGYSEGGKNQVVDFYRLTTNSEGQFSFDKKIPKKRNLEDVRVTSDSGSFYSDGAWRNMEIVVH